MTLNEAKKGENYIIEYLKENDCTVKLVEMGFLKNRTITIVSESWGGVTKCVSIGDSKIMLRSNESDSVLVRKCEIL